MDAQRIEDVTGWDDRSFADGFVGLRRLADRGFSGAATDGTGWLFMLNGRIVGVVDAELETFADATGTAYEAPDEVLPLLFAMQEGGGTKRAQYYTNDTPLSEADRKLSAGKFTGYIELSENVLSGDYYVTYTGGESRSAAYVGNSRRLETGADAFDLADDEVGIYTVYEVDLDVRDVPDTDGHSEESGADGGGDALGDAEDKVGTTGDADAETNSGASDDANAEADSDASDDGGADANSGAWDDGDAEDDATNGTDGSDRATGTNDIDAVGDISGSMTAAATDEAPNPSTVDSVDDDSDDDGVASDDAANGSGSIPDAEDVSTGATPSVSNGGRGPHPGGRNGRDDGAPGNGDGSENVSRGSRSSVPRRRTDDDVFSEEAQWRETKSIPALDPQETSERAASGTGPDRGGAEGGHRAAQTTADGDGRSPQPRAGADAQRSAVSRRPANAAGDLGEEVQRLERELADVEAERDRLAAEREELVTEREEFDRERDRLEGELADLRAERDRLREQLAGTGDGTGSAGGESIPPAQARGETNLFIRYDSKGGTTLEDVHAGGVDRESLAENLSIEYHTSFDSDGALVDGVPFEEFLTGTMEYGFTRWLVQELPFEMQDTGNENTLQELYDALPKVDRAEIGGSVSIVIREGTEETREQRQFDLVLRDRMGNPLFIADLNDTRAPTAEATLESIVANGGDIAETSDSFAAAFAVTASFFEPGALESASDAVGGGLFSRSKRKSFVKLSRKRGYHLCLVEARDGSFHLTVPDL